jgi:hypothetical protein
MPVAVLPCNNLDLSEAFYRRLGLNRTGGNDDYRILENHQGDHLHLKKADEGWLVPGRNPFGLYLYRENVDELALEFRDKIVAGPANTPWGMYEFSVSDPDDTLVKVGQKIRV